MKTNRERLMSQRLHLDYPWPVWAIGWLAVLKAFVWLGSEPANLPDDQLVFMGYKYIIFMIPLILCGIGVWNMKKWAVLGLILLAAADLLFFLANPIARGSLAFNTTSSVAYVFSMSVYIINGPPGSVMILLLSPALIKQSKPTS